MLALLVDDKHETKAKLRLVLLLLVLIQTTAPLAGALVSTPINSEMNNIISPDPQLIEKNSFGWTNYYWYQMLAQKGYIVACVDNRGTGGKGSEFKKMTYKELGKYETIDQIDAAKYFGNLDYIDKDRIGIQGWSYGGYMSSLAITKGADVFKLATSTAVSFCFSTNSF